MLGEAVLVEHFGDWLPGIVLWEYLDTGRERALVRYETPAGMVFRSLHWRDELRPAGVVLELGLMQDDQQSEPPVAHGQSRAAAHAPG